MLDLSASHCSTETSYQDAFQVRDCPLHKVAAALIFVNARTFNTEASSSWCRWRCASEGIRCSSVANLSCNATAVSIEQRAIFASPRCTALNYRKAWRSILRHRIAGIIGYIGRKSCTVLSLRRFLSTFFVTRHLLYDP